VSDKMGRIENRVVLAELVEVQPREVHPVSQHMTGRKVAMSGAKPPFLDFLNLPFDSRENPFETPGCVGRDLLEVLPPRSERTHMVLQTRATPACEATAISIAAARLQWLRTLHSSCVMIAKV